MRPLPLTPVTPTAEANQPLFHRPPSPQDSLFTIASTILPEYSSVWGDETETTWDEDDGSLTPIHEPPRYSYVLPNRTQHMLHASTPNPREASGLHTSCRGRPSFVERKLHLKNGSENPWATLKLISRGPLPNSKNKAPRFIGGDSIRGVLELNLDSPISVPSLKLNVRRQHFSSPVSEFDAGSGSLAPRPGDHSTCRIIIYRKWRGTFHYCELPTRSILQKDSSDPWIIWGVLSFEDTKA
jgi:hypothetical protein